MVYQTGPRHEKLAASMAGGDWPHGTGWGNTPPIRAQDTASPGNTDVQTREAQQCSIKLLMNRSVNLKVLDE